MNNKETARSGLLVLQFGATGMTDSAARAYSILIAQNLANTNRFQVTNPDQSEEVIIRENSSLLPCFDIGCGIQMAHILGAQRVLSGHISLTPGGMIRLSVKLVNVSDNTLEFEDALRFTDDTMDRRFYLLARRIASNTPLKGKIIDANNRTAIIDLGANDGVRVGDRLVLYKNLSVAKSSPTSVLMPSNTRRSNIGILTITKVGDHSSEGVYFQAIETPQSGQFVATFLEKAKQISLVNRVRKELDTHLRNVFEIDKTVVIKPISIEDLDKKNWIINVRRVEQARDYWQNWAVGSGIATAIILSQYQDGDDWKAISVIGSLAYSTIMYFQHKGKIKALVDEGKYKGYLDIKFNPYINEAKASWEIKF